MTKAPKGSRGLLMLFILGLPMAAVLACSARATPPASEDRPGETVSGQAGGVAAIQDGQVGLVARGGVGPSAAPGPGGPLSTGSGILVYGRGEASSAPDLAILNLGVQASGSTVSEARNLAAAAMGRVTEALRADKVAPADIQTRYFSINPKFTSTVIVGYEVTNQLTVKLRDLETVGTVIDHVTAAGGDLTRFQGINFSITDAEGLQQRARAAAIKDVLATANQVALNTGVKLGKLVYITETGGPSLYGELGLTTFSIAGGVPERPTPIKAGELEVVVTVQALYAIE